MASLLSDTHLPEMPSADLSEFRKVLSDSKNIICLAGAGLSAPSGIPTFRGSDGALWRKYDALRLSTKAGFLDSPSRVWQFEHYRRELVFKAKPNAAHLALAKFSIPAYRERVAPESTFTLITQNVDELSKKALQSVKASLPSGSIDNELSDPDHPPLIEMHGSLFDLVCTAYECGHREKNYNSPLCPALAGTELIYEADSKLPEPDIPKEDLPRCSKCGSLQRPGMVWFGEVPYRIDEILKLAENADLCLVVGTSSVVHPAAKLAGMVKAAGGKVAVFNIDRSKRDEQADFLFIGPSETILPDALRMEDV